MPSKDSTVRIKADISKLKAEMQAAARQVRVVNSEFKAATAGMEDWTKSEEGLTAKIKQLNGVLDGQKKKLDLLNQELEKTIELDGEGAASVDRLKIQINNQQAAITRTEKDLESYNQQLEDLPKNLEETSEATEKASEGFTVMKGVLADLVAEGIKTAINALKDFAQEAIQVGMDYESEMSKVGAISGATAEEMEVLSAKAKEMGESSVFSASEAASAFEYMAMAGWKTEDMLNGIEGIMNLAAASGSDLATTSDIVTDALTAMGYEAKDAGHLADVMAAASSNANTNVELMGSTFKYVAPVVGALGYDMEDTAVAIGMMANAGIKGDKAGTALRSTLNRLSAPPKECAEEMEKLGISLTDSEGKMKPLMRVMEDLRDKFEGLSETEQTAAAKHIAGQEAMSGLLAIVNGSEKDFAKLSNAITNSTGAAEEMANVMNDNVSGQLTLLQSKIQGIMINLFERASDSMKKGIETVGQALDKVDWNKVGDQVGKFATNASKFFAYIITNSSRIISILKPIGTIFATIFISQKIATTATAFKTLITVITSAGSVTKALSGAMGALGLSMSALPVMAVIASVAILYNQLKKEKAEIEENAKALYGLTEQDQKFIDSINESAEALRAANEAGREEGQEIDIQAQKLSNLKDKYNELIDENGNVKQGYEELAQELLGQLAEGLGTTIDKVKENIDLNGKLGESIDELILKKKTEAKLSAYEDDYNQALKDELKAFQELKTAKENATNAQNGLNEAKKAYDEELEKWNNLEINGFNSDKEVKALEQAKASYEEAKNKSNEMNNALKEAQATWGTTQSTIEHYQNAMSASTENNVDKMNDELLALQYGLADHTNATKTQLEQQYLNTKKELDDIRALYKEGNVSEDVVRDYERVNQLAGDELDAWVAKNKSAGSEATQNLLGSTSEGLAGVQNAVEEMSKNTLQSLDNSLGDWGAVAENKSGDFLGILSSKEGDFKKAGENSTKAVVTGASSKTGDIEKPAEEIVTKTDQKIRSLDDVLQNGGRYIPETVSKGATENASTAEAPAGKYVTNYNKAITSKADDQKAAGKEIVKNVSEGADSDTSSPEKSGNNFLQGFLNAIRNGLPSAIQIGIDLAGAALSGIKKKSEEGSPSKATYRSGKWFVAGFVNAINAGTKEAKKAAGDMTAKALKAVKETQKEGSPSKVTYQSGQNFTQGLINGIVSLEGQLITTTRELVNKTLAELLNLKNFNFSDTATSAASIFSSGFQKQLDNMIKRIEYSTQNRMKEFSENIDRYNRKANAEIAQAEVDSQRKQSQLQDQIAAEQAKKQTKKTQARIKELQADLADEQKRIANQTAWIRQKYDLEIQKQESMRDSYQEASSTMIDEFTEAMRSYQTAAQKLIDDTINGITDEYQKKYDTLISKQDNLIQKMKSAGDLFNISGANVIRLEDVQAQTAQIKQYASKLKEIKEKVSGDLFDQIASYDMEQGEAFIDQLLSMSADELKAYSDAYDEKMKASENLAKDIYKEDFDEVADNYSSAMAKAFEDLPGQLEELGYQSMKGFLEGLTSDSEYMEQSVKTFIDGMVGEFKKQLGIASPSKVAFQLGEFVGEGFTDGLLDMISAVKKAAQEVTDTVKSSLDISEDVSAAKSVISSASGTGLNRSTGSFVGDRTQIINFNQVNNSPKALDRLTIYRQTNNVLFSAKVGLANV